MKTQPSTPGRRVTVVDVARAAGVSPGTVSNAISGKRRVDQDTRDRIDRAIRELGYVPNLAARGMRTGRTNTIAIFSSMPTAVAAGPSRLGFLMEIAASAAVTALERNYVLVLIPPIDSSGTALATIPLGGAILVEPEANDPALARLRDRGVPVVTIGPAADGGGLRVLLDYEGMAAMLIDHLLEVGARNFPLIIGQSDRASNRVFRRVYEQRMDAAGLPARVLRVNEADAERGARQAVLGELDAARSMDGLLVPIDAMATGAMAALADRGLDVPGDVKLATRYDGIRARSESPPLTALNLHLDAVAQLATDLLIGSLETQEQTGLRRAPGPELLVRGSTRLPK